MEGREGGRKEGKQGWVYEGTYARTNKQNQLKRIAREVDENWPLTVTHA